jgi:hypothetical protein
MSFTVGSLLARESFQFLEIYFENKDWKKAKKIAVENNILQSNKISTCQRVITELYSRLKLLNSAELNFLKQETGREQLLILWLAFCRKYSFVYQFAAELIHNRVQNFNAQLDLIDFDLFFETMSLQYPQLESIPESRKNKLRQVLFRTLKEAEILDKELNIKTFIPSQNFLKTLYLNSGRDLIIFPIV